MSLYMLGGKLVKSGSGITSNNDSSSLFPLGIDSSGRFLTTVQGAPFLLHGDSGWTAEVQLTTAQIDTYLDDRRARGFTAIMFELVEHLYSSQTPAYDNAYGAAPFTTMSPVSWESANNTYWQTVDYLISGCYSRGLACVVFPAWFGFSGGSQGWYSDINAASTAHLQAYGTFLATRYGRGNVIWGMGGDYSGTGSADRAQQWNIATGIRSVLPNALICAEPARTDVDSYNLWGPGGDNYTGWNVNALYTDNVSIPAGAAQVYGRGGPTPGFAMELYYEGEHSMTTDGVAYEAVQSYLSGLCGHFFGNNPLWGFGEPNDSGGLGPANALANDLNTPGANAMSAIGSLLKTYAWWKLVPKTGATLVSSALGTGASAVCPALASDGSFALIGKSDANSITVVMTNFTIGSVRARWYDPTNGTYSSVSGSPFTNTGSQTIANPGTNSVGGTAWILVMDHP